MAFSKRDITSKYSTFVSAMMIIPDIVNAMMGYGIHGEMENEVRNGPKGIAALHVTSLDFVSLLERACDGRAGNKAEDRGEPTCSRTHRLIEHNKIPAFWRRKRDVKPQYINPQSRMMRIPKTHNMSRMVKLSDIRSISDIRRL
jgi:hypothetical protein